MTVFTVGVVLGVVVGVMIVVYAANKCVRLWR